MSLLGFLGNVAGGFLTGGPVGAIAGGAASLLGSRGSTPPQTVAPAARYSAPTPQFANPVGTSVALVNRVLPSLPGAGPIPQLPDSVKTTGGTSIAGGLFQSGGSSTAYYSPSPAAQGHACPVGYHWNRTSYYTRGGKLVAKGTKCVKNRRRNPLNPRAMSRAMSRIHSAKKAAHFLDRIQIGPKRRRR